MPGRSARVCRPDGGGKKFPAAHIFCLTSERTAGMLTSKKGFRVSVRWRK